MISATSCVVCYDELWVQRGPNASRSSLSTLFCCPAAISLCTSLSRDTAEWCKTASKPRASSACCTCRRKVSCVSGARRKCSKFASATHDGRMDIQAVGRAPFRIVELINAGQYDDGMLLEGAVDYLDDHERPVDPKKQSELVQLFEVCHTIVYRRLSAQREGFGARGVVLRDRGHAADGFDVETASARVALRGRSAGAAGDVSARVGAASTEDRIATTTCRRKRQFCELDSCAPLWPRRMGTL